MGEFFAWAMTGHIAELQVWSDAKDRLDSNDRSEESGSKRIATRLPEQQKFLLRGRDGREIAVHLVDSGIALRNGHVVTIAWAAREGATHGHCVLVNNHTTGAETRLEANLQQVRSQVKASKIAVFGMLATLPAAFAIAAWLLMPDSLVDIDASIILFGASVVLAVLFCVGAIVAKLVFDYLRSEDDDKIWAAVDKALATDDQQQHQPQQQRNVRVANRS